MYQVILSDPAVRRVEEYASRYAQYDEDLYFDTGIFWVDQIVEQYRSEAKDRDIFSSHRVNQIWFEL